MSEKCINWSREMSKWGLLPRNSFLEDFNGGGFVPVMDWSWELYVLWNPLEEKKLCQAWWTHSDIVYRKVVAKKFKDNALHMAGAGGCGVLWVPKSVTNDKVNSQHNKAWVHAALTVKSYLELLYGMSYSTRFILQTLLSFDYWVFGRM